MKYYLLPILLCCHTVSAESLTATQSASVAEIIQYFKTQNIEALSQVVDYPLTRPQPLPSITNARQFKTHFNQIFDQKIQNQLAQSKLQDWSQVGWRGIMFDAGQVWISNVDDQQPAAKHAKIIAVNYSGEAEQALLKNTLAAQKSKLHRSIQIFEHPELLFKTKNYLIRIDALKNGQYRYVAWKNHQDQSKKPNLVLNHGRLTADGSGGNHSFVFNNGIYHYEVYRHVIAGESDIDVSVVIKKNGQTLMQQDGYLVTY